MFIILFTDSNYGGVDFFRSFDNKEKLDEYMESVGAFLLEKKVETWGQVNPITLFEDKNILVTSHQIDTNYMLEHPPEFLHPCSNNQIYTELHILEIKK